MKSLSQQCWPRHRVVMRSMSLSATRLTAAHRFWRFANTFKFVGTCGANHATAHSDHWCRMIRAGALHRANGGYLLLKPATITRTSVMLGKASSALKSRKIKLLSVLSKCWPWRVAYRCRLRPMTLMLKVILLGEADLHIMSCWSWSLSLMQYSKCALIFTMTWYAPVITNWRWSQNGWHHRLCQSLSI